MKNMKLVPTLIATAIVAFLAIPLGLASDHVDAPLIAQDHASDLGDTYAFLDPNDPSKVVLIMTTNPFVISSEAIGQAIFDHRLRYRFEIETTGDATPDRFVDIRYSKGLGRGQVQTATITLPNGHSFTAPTTPSVQGDTPPELVVTNDASGASFFGGSADDPFFMDNTAANRFVLSSIANPGNPDRTVFAKRAGPDRIGRDTYAGFNILVTAISVPASILTGSSAGNVIGVNSVAQRLSPALFPGQERRFVTIDRDGLPLVNNGLIPAPRKDQYNASPTQADANGRFRADLIQSLRNFGNSDAHIEDILDVIADNGDILRLRLDTPTKFPNGRTLQDDIADAVFTLINNGQPLTDFVDGNDGPFRTRFPFVADPIQPNPLGIDNVDDRTRL